MRRSFKNAENKKIRDKMTAVRKHVEAAIQDLAAIEATYSDAGRHDGRYDFAHYRTELEQMLSCDDGEAGMLTLFAIIERGLRR